LPDRKQAVVAGALQVNRRRDAFQYEIEFDFLA
jgi:hypothetical protein